MRPMQLEEIRRAIHGRWLVRGEPTVIDAVSIDTRTAQGGELFVAIEGERFDGHDFLAKAHRGGCVAALVRLDREPPPSVAKKFPAGIIAAPDTVTALGALGKYHRELFTATVIAVTGSNGKTTVKRMIHHILSRQMSGTCSPKSFNNAIGVPLTLLEIKTGDDYVVCEIGSSGPGEVSALSRIVHPDIAVITGIAESHLEHFGDITRVAAEKASILGRISADSMAVVWADSKLLDRAIRAYDCRLVRFGESSGADLRLSGYEQLNRGQRFEMNDKLWVDLPISGRHNAINALAAIGVARRIGFSREAAAAALADFEPVEMRLQWIDCGVVTVINDAYNANPASMLAAANVLSQTQAVRKVMIAGDMRALGEKSRQLHLQTGEQIARLGVDLLIAVGREGRYIAKAAGDAGIETEVFESVPAARRALGDLLRQGDVVLIKGSRAMRMESLVGAISSVFGCDLPAPGE